MPLRTTRLIIRRVNQSSYSSRVESSLGGTREEDGDMCGHMTLQQSVVMLMVALLLLLLLLLPPLFSCSTVQQFAFSFFFPFVVRN